MIHYRIKTFRKLWSLEKKFNEHEEQIKRLKQEIKSIKEQLVKELHIKEQVEARYEN